MTNIMDEESLTELLKDLDIELIPKRNELCYCGSREKYKYCCLEKDQKPKEIVHLEFDVCDDPFVLLDQGEALSIEDEDKLLNIIDLLDEDDSNADAELIADLQAML